MRPPGSWKPVHVSSISVIYIGRPALSSSQVMEPFTASKLRMRKNNVLKDFVNVAGPLGVTHFMIFNQTDIGTNLVCMGLWGGTC